MKTLRALLLIPLLCLAGCDSDSRSQWEVTVQNQCKTPCSFAVTFGADGASSANVDNLVAGKPTILIVGDLDTVVHTVKTTFEKDDVEELQPDLRLPVGKRCAIIVNDQGNVEVRVEDK